MSVVYCRKTRRQFLVGTGKTLLLLPVLPSLLPAEAQAQTVLNARRMMLFCFDHNNLQTIWPQRSVATTAVGSSGAKEIMMKSIGPASSIGPAFRAAAWQSIIDRDLVTMLKGTDQSGGGHGNQVLAAGEGRQSEGGYPTIDTIIEGSKTVYPATTSLAVKKAIRINLGGGWPVYYQKVGTTVQNLAAYEEARSIRAFYNDVFSGLTNGTVSAPDTTVAVKTNILNRVHSSYMSFKGSRKISSEDRARLDQHMGYLRDLQNSLALAGPAPGVSTTCIRPGDPGVPTTPQEMTPLYFDLLAMAFKCGLTRFGSMLMADPTFLSIGLPAGADFHGAMHGSLGGDLQTKAFNAYWGYYGDLIATRFLAKLDEQEGSTGRTYLDNMVTGMICGGGACGLGNDGGHGGGDSQQILIGSMGGMVRSGRYVAFPYPPEGLKGLPYNTFLITLLQLMGVPPSEYAYATADGRGIGYYGQFSATHPHRARFYSPVSEILKV